MEKQPERSERARELWHDTPGGANDLENRRIVPGAAAWLAGRRERGTMIGWLRRGLRGADLLFRHATARAIEG